MDAALPQRIDFFRLALNLGGNRKTMAYMLELFLHASSEQLKILEGAKDSLNVIVWLQTLHTLKGAAHNITAKRLASLCIEAEGIRQLPDAQASAVLYHISKELAQLREAITAHLTAA